MKRIERVLDMRGLLIKLKQTGILSCNLPLFHLPILYCPFVLCNYGVLIVYVFGGGGDPHV